MRVIFRPPGRAPYALSLERLTEHVRASRMLRTMGRLSNILGRANDAQLRLEKAVEEDVRKYVERVDHIHKTRERVFMEKHTALDGHMSDLTEFSKDLEEFGRNERPLSDGDAPVQHAALETPYTKTA